MLQILLRASRERTGAMARRGRSFERWLSALFATYVDVMLARPRRALHGRSPRYARHDTMRWLGWLASTMRRRHQTLYHLDWMQPDWLPTAGQRRLVTWGLAAAMGAIAGLTCGTIAAFGERGLGAPPPSVPIAGLMVGLATALMTAWQSFRSTIEPAERLRLSPTRALRAAPVAGLAVLGGLGYGALLGTQTPLATFGPGEILRRLLLEGVLGANASGGLGGAVLGAFIAATIFVLHGLQGRASISRSAPGQAMRRSGRTALVAASLALISTGLGYGFLLGLPSATILAMRLGGAAYLRHHALRLLLARQGLLPWDLAAFLAYAEEQLLLHSVDGGHLFIHYGLQEYFADLE